MLVPIEITVPLGQVDKVATEWDDANHEEDSPVIHVTIREEGSRQSEPEE